MWCTPPALKPYTTILKSHCSQPLSTPTPSSPFPFLFSVSGLAIICRCRSTHERNSIGKAIGSRPRVLFIPTVGPASLCHRCSMLRERMLYAASAMQALRHPRPRGYISYVNLKSVGCSPRIECKKPACTVAPVCVALDVLKPCASSQCGEQQVHAGCT